MIDFEKKHPFVPVINTFLKKVLLEDFKSMKKNLQIDFLLRQSLGRDGKSLKLSYKIRAKIHLKSCLQRIQHLTDAVHSKMSQSLFCVMFGFGIYTACCYNRCFSNNCTKNNFR